MPAKREPSVEAMHRHDFEIEPLEERIAPSTAVTFYQFQNANEQGPWLQTGDGFVFVGRDPA